MSTGRENNKLYEAYTAKGEFRHETDYHHSLLFIVSIITVFFCAASLGTIRLYGLYLEHRIAEVSKKTALNKEENLGLSRKYSQILSPARVYAYANKNLNMTNNDSAKIIRVDARVIAGSSEERVVQAKAEQPRMNNPFIKRANANN